MVKEETVTVRMRLPASLYERLKALALSEHRSANAQLVYLLERALSDEPSPQERESAK